jgi:predicted nuclease of predicted toxin-antitoxin system
MRFLIDEDVDVRVIRNLKKLGHDVRRVPAGAKNGEVIRIAQQEQRILITRDSDFINTSHYPPSRHCGIVHLAIHPPWLEKIFLPLKRFLKTVAETELQHHVFILKEDGYRKIS